MKQKKVLHIAPGFLYGGIEKRLVDWYKLMDRDLIRFDVVKVTPDTPNRLVAQIEELGGKVFSIPPLGARTAIAHIQAIRNIVREGNYTAIHSHSLSYGYFPLKEAKKLGCKKRILHSRTIKSNPGEHMVAAKNVLAHLSQIYATDFFACSNEAGDAAFRGRHKFRVINNGIFLDSFTYDQQIRRAKRYELGISDEFVVGYVGRFSPPKNIPFLFRMFALLHKKKPSTKLLVVGDTNDIPSIKAEVDIITEQNDMSDSIIYAGRQEQTTAWMDAMDAFVLPSLFEGFGTVSVEAQANGLPCVLSDNVPVSTNVTGEAIYLPLIEERWVEELLGLSSHARNPGDIQKIADAGFDVRTTAKWLEQFYLSEVDN